MESVALTLARPRGRMKGKDKEISVPTNNPRYRIEDIDLTGSLQVAHDNGVRNQQCQEA